MRKIEMKVDVTNLFDTYGYMHRQRVKDKVIDKFIKSLSELKY